MNGPWDFLAQCLAEHRAATLLVVTEHRGSTPGKRGFKMAVDDRGTRWGTIGGGIMELNLIARAREKMADGDHRAELIVQTHREKAPSGERSGMICAGTQRIAVYHLKPSDSGALKAIKRAVDESRKGELTLSPEGLGFSDSREGNEGLSEKNRDFWSYRESINRADTVYVVGSGHVGLALCRVLATLDLFVTAYDDRPEVDTLVQNVYAHRKIVAPYDELGEHVIEGNGSYVVVVTTGFQSDAAALAQVVRKDFRYLGLMGSAAKIRKIFQYLRDRGISERDLNKVRAPVGIPIHNRTPAEIAVSIAAEIVKVRNTPLS